MNTPTPGDVVTVITQYPNDYYYSDKKFRTHEYQKVRVLRPQRKIRSDEFCIPADGAPYIAFRVISMKHVKQLTIHGKVDTETQRVDSSTKTVEIAGSRGNSYAVTIENGTGTKCTCPGFQFRRTCRHLKEAEQV